MSEKLKEWVKLSEQLKDVKTKEMKLRKEICSEILFGLPLPAKETTIIDGIEVTATNTVTHKLDEVLVNAIFAELSDSDKNSLNFKPALLLREYKKLPDSSLLHQAVTIKPSSPTLKVV